jgi:hypothetical protein
MQIHTIEPFQAVRDLELSIRRRAPLATLDGKLLGAARRAGVELFSGEAA